MILIFNSLKVDVVNIEGRLPVTIFQDSLFGQPITIASK